MLVSIVTPSFNQGRFLRRTIESVLSQDYPHFEYIVCDGGSTDESLDVLRRIHPHPQPLSRGERGERFRWSSEPDHGQTDAINKGLRFARGDILAYLNSDDVLLPGAIAMVVRHFQERPEWDLIYGNAHHIDEDDRVIGHYPTADYSFEQIVQNCCICQPAAFWRRRVLDRIGPFDDSLHYAMDYEYWLRLGAVGGTLVHVPEFLACSRIHPQTKTLSARMEVYREILEVSRRHAGDASFSQYYAYWHHRCHERESGWPRLLRWLPDCHWWLAYMHRRWRRACYAASGRMLY